MQDAAQAFTRDRPRASKSLNFKHEATFVIRRNPIAGNARAACDQAFDTIVRTTPDRHALREDGHADRLRTFDADTAG
jgi:hypothetical protein